VRLKRFGGGMLTVGDLVVRYNKHRAPS
jgi:hypothetical protein